VPIFTVIGTAGEVERALILLHTRRRGEAVARLRFLFRPFDLDRSV
jgi:hypothetical protein